MPDEKLAPYPEKDARSPAYEVARTAIDAATSVVPGGSYLAGKIVERFVAEPLQKRRDAWFARVGDGLAELEARLSGFDPEHLPENDDFVSAVYEATQAAMKTTREEKLEALRNGILNVAAGMTLEELLRGTFFSLIDRFTPSHLRVLALVADPSSSAAMRERAKQIYAGAQIDVLRAAIPEDQIDRASMSSILGDLQREALADTGGMNAMGTQGSLLTKRSTIAGDLFLRFVSSPFTAPA